MTVLVTGATGFVGGEVLARLLAGGEEVIAVARGPRAEERVADALAGARAGASAGQRVRVVCGDLTDPGLELPAADTIVHCAASVSFALPLAEARAINVGAARALVEHAARHDARLVHVSTAYVAGCHRGLFRESQLLCGQRFRNTYEQTKLEAELLVRKSDVDAVVLRPSIIVGDSTSGRTRSFNVLYWPLRAFARGLLLAIPARPSARVDVVPVDYVADAIAHVVTERPDVRGTLHLVAGSDAVTVDELLDLACATLERERPPLVTPHDGGRGGLLAHSPEAARYLPYFDMDVIFGDRRAHGVLRPAGLAPPLLRDYFATIVDYAQRVRWGTLPRRGGDARPALARATAR